MESEHYCSLELILTNALHAAFKTPLSRVGTVFCSKMGVQLQARSLQRSASNIIRKEAGDLYYPVTLWVKASSICRRPLLFLMMMMMPELNLTSHESFVVVLIHDFLFFCAICP